MFDPSDQPRVFGLGPGVDFAAALVDGLRARMSDRPPHEMAHVLLIVNTARMKRRIRDMFAKGPAGFVPRIRLLNELADPLDLLDVPAPVSGLRRRLELVELLGKLLDADPSLAPRSSLYDLADSLATLMDEMQGEGVPPERIENLSVEDQSGHWQRALSFIKIVQRYFENLDEPPDYEALQRLAMLRLMEGWDASPPKFPVILAGSTGSRGTTALLMKAVAQLPKGAVIIPGFDFDTPQDVWDTLSDALTGEDHPQFRFSRLMQSLDLDAGDIVPWVDTTPPSAARNKVMSLALRPAPVTHQWLKEGPELPLLDEAMQDVTLLQTATKRDEALCIAMRLRKAAEEGQTAALITPDRMLTRQVTSALARWDILPDDSAGTPLQLTPPGRFLRHVAHLMRPELTAEALLTVLKHPLTHTGAGRNEHLLHTRDLELHIRRKGWPFPQAEQIMDWGEAQDLGKWADWVVQSFVVPPIKGELPLGTMIAQHIERAEHIVAGSDSENSKELWAQNAGREVRRVVDDLQREASYGGDMSVVDYSDLFGAILSEGQVRDRDAPHPHILIWGTLEARVMGADLLILGGLNEGSWPEIPSADPWLNRKMRNDAGMLLPERRIGLAAHDFQQAFGAQEVWLTRAAKSDDAETVPSRWVNRLLNLMRGLPERNGPETVKQMSARGDHWIAMARVLEAPLEAPKAERPSPCPPVVSRPSKISVTDVQRLIRDPYAIYAKHVLRLRPMDPLQKVPDALIRGTVLHAVFEQFVKDVQADPDQLRRDRLEQISHDILLEEVPWPSFRHVWQARIRRVSDWFVAQEAMRRVDAHPIAFEVTGTATIERFGFTLTGKADRIDLDGRGCALIYDYKTGTPPSEAQQEEYDKQLLLEAAMIENGAFQNIGAKHVEQAVYIGLNASPKEVQAPLGKMPAAKVWAQFETLIEAYMSEDTGFTARRSMFKDTDFGDYDQLSRFGEWDVTQDATREVLK